LRRFSGFSIWSVTSWIAYSWELLLIESKVRGTTLSHKDPEGCNGLKSVARAHATQCKIFLSLVMESKIS
jgi:hypothetical protein